MAAAMTFQSLSPVAGQGGGAAAPWLAARATAEREAQASAARAAGPRLGPAPAAARDGEGLAGVGRPLPAPLRAGEEARLGVDLSAVRLHDDAGARQALAETGARALAHGEDVAMEPADTRADTAERARLLRHELAHVAQQARPGGAPQLQADDARAEGIGAAPPEEPFVTMEGEAGSEDGHVLFGTNDAALSPAARGRLEALVAGRDRDAPPPQAVHVHGYSSLEGGAGYNLNLSAHRAVAARDALAALMPEGTRFILYAHGESRAFGDRAANRRVGIDVIERGDGSFLGGGPGLEFGVGLGFGERRRLRLFEPGELRLTPPSLTTPEPGAPSPGPVAPPRLPPGYDPDAGGPPRLPPLALTPAPALPGDRPFDFGGVAPLFARRGLVFEPGMASDVEAHYRFWRERFVLWGLPPDLAARGAQMGTELMVGNHLSNQFPTRAEQLDRQFGTEPPPTITIMNETRMIWIYENIRSLLGGRE